MSDGQLLLITIVGVVIDDDILVCCVKLKLSNGHKMDGKINNDLNNLRNIIIFSCGWVRVNYHQHKAGGFLLL
jgi:hypothetical protein